MRHNIAVLTIVVLAMLCFGAFLNHHVEAEKGRATARVQLHASQESPEP